MIELVSWVGVGIIALFAVVGFTGVVVTSLVSLVRMVGERRTQDHAQVQPAVPVR
jgi:hypothetical protein